MEILTWPGTRALDYSVDVLVIGAGIAGEFAAIEAYDSGAPPLIIDKCKSQYQNESTFCGGRMAIPNWRQKKEGIIDSPELLYEDMMRVGKYSSDPNILKFYVNNVKEAYDKLTKLGILSTGLIYQGGHSVKRSICHNSIKVLEKLTKQIKKRGINILFNTRAKRFIVDLKTKRIHGIEAILKGDPVLIGAKATILATGGMCGDPQMIDRYIPKLRGYSVVDMRLKNSTGDGYKMAMSIGADITHMHVATSYPRGIAINGRYGVSFHNNEGIYVNKEGKRFVEEIKTAPCEIGESVLNQKDKCQYTIVDNHIWKKGNFRFWGNSGTGQELLQSIRSSKWIVPIFINNTITGLANEAGIDPDGLSETIYNYNRFVEKGIDLDFKRPKKFLIKIEEPPFVAIKQVLMTTHGGGGLRTNTHLQIIDVQGNIIPGLYGCGEVIGGTTGEIYLTSTHYPVAMAFGYWAGKFAAQEVMNLA